MNCVVVLLLRVPTVHTECEIVWESALQLSLYNGLPNPILDRTLTGFLKHLRLWIVDWKLQFFLRFRHSAWEMRGEPS